MLRSSLRQLPIIAAVPLILLLSAATLGAERPRLRPTPAPTPPAPAASAAPGAVTTPAPTEGPTAPTSDLPPAAGCFGLGRPEPSGAPAGPVASAGPPVSPARSTAPTASPSPTPKPTPKPTPTPGPDETARYKIKTAGVRLDLPGDWLGLEGDDLAALEEVPELTEALSALEASSLVFLGIDVLPGEGCEVGGNLSLYDLGEALDPRLLELSVEAIALGLEELDEVEGDVKTSTVDLPVGEAQRLTFRFDATADGAVTSWWVRADVFTASGRTLFAAYAAPEAATDDAKPVFTAIAKSIREL